MNQPFPVEDGLCQTVLHLGHGAGIEFRSITDWVPRERSAGVAVPELPVELGMTQILRPHGAHVTRATRAAGRPAFGRGTRRRAVVACSVAPRCQRLLAGTRTAETGNHLGRDPLAVGQCLVVGAAAPVNRVVNRLLLDVRQQPRRRRSALRLRAPRVGHTVLRVRQSAVRVGKRLIHVVVIVQP